MRYGGATSRLRSCPLPLLWRSRSLSRVRRRALRPARCSRRLSGEAARRRARHARSSPQAPLPHLHHPPASHIRHHVVQQRDVRRLQALHLARYVLLLLLRAACSCCTVLATASLCAGPPPPPLTPYPPSRAESYLFEPTSAGEKQQILKIEREEDGAISVLGECIGGRTAGARDGDVRRASVRRVARVSATPACFIRQREGSQAQHCRLSRLTGRMPRAWPPSSARRADSSRRAQTSCRC
jgi:hypothetical protein